MHCGQMKERNCDVMLCPILMSLDGWFFGERKGGFPSPLTTCITSYFAFNIKNQRKGALRHHNAKREGWRHHERQKAEHFPFFFAVGNTAKREHRPPKIAQRLIFMERTLSTSPRKEGFLSSHRTKRHPHTQIYFRTTKKKKHRCHCSLRKHRPFKQ